MEPDTEERKRELAVHLARLLDGYSEIFCGEAQTLSKLRETFVHFHNPVLRRWGRKLAKRLRDHAVQRGCLHAAGDAA